MGMIENVQQHLQSTRRELGHDTEQVDNDKKSAYSICHYKSFGEINFEIN